MLHLGYKNLQKLDLRQYKNYYDPQFHIDPISDVLDVTHLYLSCNCIYSLKDVLNLDILENLQLLNMGCNELKTLQGIEDIQKLKHLKSLSFYYNQLEEITNELKVEGGFGGGVGGLYSLEELNLNRNKLKVNVIINLPNLKYLYIADNELSEWPILNTPNLERLDLSNNHLIQLDINQSHFHFPKLKQLNLSWNGLANIHFSDFILGNLEILNLECNQIQEISTLNVSVFSNLLYLSLKNNSIRGLEIRGLSQLKKLDLGYNYISRMENLESLCSLEILYLNSNRIEDMTSLFCLPNLKQVWLDNNPIKVYRRIHSQAEVYISDDWIEKVDCLVETTFPFGNSFLEGINKVRRIYYTHKRNAHFRYGFHKLRKRVNTRKLNMITKLKPYYPVRRNIIKYL